jgi:hypothetical protein
MIDPTDRDDYATVAARLRALADAVERGELMGVGVAIARFDGAAETQVFTHRHGNTALLLGAIAMVQTQVARVPWPHTLGKP